MAAQTNGRAKKPKKTTPNGTANGGLNGYANGSMNGHAEKMQLASTSTRTASKRRPRRSFSGFIASLFAR